MSTPSTPPPPRPDGVNLLDRIAETALDDDYYLVPDARPRRRSLQVVSVVSLALVAVVITVAALQGRTTRPSSSLERDTLAADVQERRELLDSRRAAVGALQAQLQSLQATSRTEAETTGQRVITGQVAAQGQGVVATARDSSSGSVDGRVGTTDLRFLVNGLSDAGAEAISVNGHRLGAQSALVPLDGGITVDYVRIASPYRVVALGDASALRQRFEDGATGEYWDRREQRSGLSFGLEEESDLTVPAAPERRSTVRVAQVAKDDADTAGGNAP